MVPPPQPPREPTTKPNQKSLKPNPPISILFAKQRESQYSPKKTFLHLVTLFSVHLRVYPFSELSPKPQIPKNLFNQPSIDPILGSFSSSLIRGLSADLILFVTRFTVTHIFNTLFHSESF
jgi:hypothetical protein